MKCSVLQVLPEIISFLEKNAVEHHYGYPVCKDPRHFKPDPECCTEEEIAAWKEACKRAEAGEKVEIPKHEWFSNEEGCIVHVNRSPWGIGVNTLYNEEVYTLLRKIKKAVKEAKQSPLCWGTE